MRRFVTNSGIATFLSFALVMVLVEAGTRKVRANLPVDPGKWPRIEIAQKLDNMDRAVARRVNFDVVFVGSSVMAGGIDPVEFTEASGVSSYNASFAGSSARTSAAWALDIVEPLLHPSVVVLGVQSGELNDNGPKNQITYRKFLASPGYKQTKANFTGRVSRWFERLSDFVRYRLAFRTPTNLFRQDKARLAATKVRKEVGDRGKRVEEAVDYRFTSKFETNFYDKNLEDLSFGGREYRAMVRLHERLAKRGAKLVVIATPVTEDYYNLHANPERDKTAFQALMERFRRETGATVIEASDAFPTSGPFRDPVHLDVEGRIAFSRALAERWGAIASSDGRRFEMECEGEAEPRCRVVGP